MNPTPQTPKATTYIRIEASPRAMAPAGAYVLGELAHHAQRETAKTRN